MIFAVTDEVWKYGIDHLPAIIAAVFAGWAILRSQSKKDAAVEKKKNDEEKVKNDKDRSLLDNVAGALRDRATLAAKQGDLVEFVNGNMVLTPRGRQVIEPIRQDVLDYYRHNAHRRSTAELFWELHQVFGTVVMQKICEPHGLVHLECYSALVALCRETQFVGDHPKPPSWRPETITQSKENPS